MPQPRRKVRYTQQISGSQIPQTVVFKTFPADSFAEDMNWTSDEQMVRDSTFVRIDYAHVDRDLQAKWAFTNNGEFGYATVLSEAFPPGGPLWSLSGFTAELVAAIGSAHALFGNIGYLGEAYVHVSANPGDGELYVERGKLPFIRHCSGRRTPPQVAWSQIVPKPPLEPTKRWVNSMAPSNFNSRTASIGELSWNILQPIRPVHRVLATQPRRRPDTVSSYLR